jgi:hypothetical protein
MTRTVTITITEHHEPALHPPHGVSSAEGFLSLSPNPPKATLSQKEREAWTLPIRVRPAAATPLTVKT